MEKRGHASLANRSLPESSNGSHVGAENTQIVYVGESHAVVRDVLRAGRVRTFRASTDRNAQVRASTDRRRLPLTPARAHI